MTTQPDNKLTKPNRFKVTLRDVIFIILGVGGLIHQTFIVASPNIVILFWSLMICTLAPVLKLDKEGATIHQLLMTITAKPQLPPPADTPTDTPTEPKPEEQKQLEQTNPTEER